MRRKSTGNGKLRFVQIGQVWCLSHDIIIVIESNKHPRKTHGVLSFLWKDMLHPKCYEMSLTISRIYNANLASLFVLFRCLLFFYSKILGWTKIVHELQKKNVLSQHSTHFNMANSVSSVGAKPWHPKRPKKNVGRSKPIHPQILQTHQFARQV